jgi:CHRD domain-containing protein
MAMRRLLLLGLGLLPLVLFGFGTDAIAGQTDGVNGEGGRPFTAVLLGINERPVVATNSDLIGTAKVTINLGQSELCWDLDYTTSQHVVAAHIHHGVAGVAAPVIFGFFNPPASATPVNSGCRVGPPALLADIAAHPENYYVNVHTTLYPGGAGRGQLTK